MTLNQVAYWNLVEANRHATVTEQETERHDREYERETNRHNVASEKNQYLSAMAAQSSAAAAHRQAAAAEQRVQNDYLLGIKNLAIGAHRADTERMNALTNQRLAATNEQNARINQFKAMTDRAKTNIQGRELGLKQDQFAFNQFTTGVYNPATNKYAGYNSDRFMSTWKAGQAKTITSTITGGISDIANAFQKVVQGVSKIR